MVNIVMQFLVKREHVITKYNNKYICEKEMNDIFIFIFKI